MKKSISLVLIICLISSFVFTVNAADVKTYALKSEQTALLEAINFKN